MVLSIGACSLTRLSGSDRCVSLAALAEERCSHKTQRDEYVLVRQAWLQRGIECLVFKSAGNAPSFPYTSDNVDIIVRPEQGRAARDVLRQLGYIDIRTVEEPHKY